jgi:chitin synthase
MPGPRTTLARQKVSLRNLFLAGKVGSRRSPQCLSANYIPLLLPVIMVAITGGHYRFQILDIDP